MTIALLQSLELQKNINDYLAQNDEVLWNYYQQVIKQSRQRSYPIYRQRYIIDAKSYESLNLQAKRALNNQIVFASIIMEGEPVYSPLGGVSIKGILAQDQEEGNAKRFFFKLDGRYLSDLQALDKRRRIYLYCILPSFNQCVLLGIGEEWKGSRH